MARNSKDRIEDLLKQNKLSDDQLTKFQRLYDQLIKNNGTAAEFQNLLGDILLAVDKISDSADFVAKSFNDTLNENRKIVGSLLKQKKALKGIEGIASKVQSIRLGESDASVKTLEADLEILEQRRELLRIASLGNDIEEDKRQEILAQVEAADEAIAAQKELVEVSKRVKNELGFINKYTIEDAIIGIKSAFKRNEYIDSLKNDIYFNVKMMKKINLE